MLKDSALLTIDLALELLAHNMTLQDATPYNIAFDYSEPLFLDFTSICPVDPSFLWKPYGQFLRLFLFPLILYSFGAHSVARNIFYEYYRGIEYSEIRKILPFLFRIKSFFSLEMPYILEKYKPDIKNFNISKYADNRMRKKFLLKLKNKIEKLVVKRKRNIWLSYYDYDPNLPRKANIIEMIINEIKPKKVLDLGANTGYFSFMVAERGINVVAIDNSWECVDSIYIKSRKEKRKILPLCIDLLSPTPQFGWNLSQYEDFFKRFKSDFVMMLAILHHLVLKQWQNFERITMFANQITKEYFLIEFIDEKDEKVKKLSSEIPEWYNYESLINILSKSFKILKEERITNTRVLILCKKDLAA